MPAAPSNLNLLAGGGDFDPFYGGAIAILSWPSVPNAAGYNVYRSTDGTNFTLLTPSPQSGLEYTDLSISNGSTYSYTVTAANYAGESSRSSLATATPLETVRQAPEVKASNRDGFIFLSWKPDPLTTPQFGTAFNVKRSDSPDGPFSTILQINTYNAYDYSAAPSKTYYYVVTQTNRSGESSPSNVVSAQADKPGWLGFGGGSSDIPDVNQ
jgi:fibronectin type 3 domain-containing protein